VTPFAGDLVAPGDKHAVDHNAAADAGPENDPEYHAGAGPGAVDRLGKRKAIGIIFQADRPVQLFRQIAVERLAVQDRAVRVLEQASPCRDRSRRGEAYGTPLTQISLGAKNEVGDCVQCAGIVSSRCRCSASQQRRSAVIERNHLDLGSPQVDTDPHSASYSLCRAVAFARPEIGRSHTLPSRRMVQELETGIGSNLAKVEE
jgi:hypothetical protein